MCSARLAAARHSCTRFSSMALPSATLAAMVSLNITTSWLTMANWLRREARFQVLSSCPSSVIWPWLLLTKRGSRLTRVVLPAPEGPTSATISPGATRRLTLLSAGACSAPKETLTWFSTISPRTRSAVCVPSDSAPVSPSSDKPRSSAATPRVMGLATSASRRMGAISINIAVMNETNPPTVTSLESTTPRLCHRAMQITTDKAAAANNWVSGVMAAEAMVDLIARRRRLWLSAPKRLAWLCWAPCRRTMRWASTFSSTT